MTADGGWGVMADGAPMSKELGKASGNRIRGKAVEGVDDSIDSGR